MAFKERLEFDPSRKSKKSQESQELPKMSWHSRRGWAGVTDCCDAKKSQESQE